jgi:hypothetical protein
VRRCNPPPPTTKSPQWVTISVLADGQTDFVLPFAPALDDDGDALILEFKVSAVEGGTYPAAREDYAVDGTALTWTASISLHAGDELAVLITPA